VGRDFLDQPGPGNGRNLDFAGASKFFVRGFRGLLNLNLSKLAVYSFSSQCGSVGFFV
jgi:hypothetical protein